jgi:hypothetical protein
MSEPTYDFENSGVDASSWDTMTLSELIDQRNRLYSLYEYVMTKEYAKNFQQGIDQLDAIIASKLK